MSDTPSARQPRAVDIKIERDTIAAKIVGPVVEANRAQVILDDVGRAMEDAKAKGASRAIPLQVSGAFHSPLMQPAVDGLTGFVEAISFQAPSIPVIGNTTALPMTTGEAVKTELLEQLCHPVQWQRSVEYMVENGVVTFIEIGPGKVLTGLIRRINPDVTLVNLGDLEAVKNFGPLE